MADLRITQLPPLATADVESAVDLVAVADVSASETKKLTVAGAVAAGIPSVVDGSIPGSKLAPNSVTANELAPDSVGASELADQAVDGNAIQTGAVSGSALPTPRNHIVGRSIGSADIADDQVVSRLIADGAVQAAHVGSGQISGSAGFLPNTHIEAASIAAADLANDAVGAAQLADNSVDAGALQVASVHGSATTGGKVHISAGTISTADLADGGVTNAKLAAGIDGAKLTDSTVSNAKLSGGITPNKLANTTGPAHFIAGPTTGPGVVTERAIVGNDLPTATTTDKGAVSVPSNQGLRISGTGIEIDNDIVGSGGGFGIVQVSDKGLATAFKPLSGSDLPVATNAVVGGVSVPGPGLVVDGAGALRHDTSGVVAGTYSKVTVNEFGHVTTGSSLLPTDVPNLDASKINTGTFDAARIADGSITNVKLTNYATTFIQEAEPVRGEYVGQFWYKESDAQLRTWSGNSWIPVGFGRLSNENLRFCGTFDAATGRVITATSFGTQAGLADGQVIPGAAAPLTGAYLVAAVPGTYGGDVYDNGDWTLCLGTGWVRIDTLNGGGGVTIKLSDLLDTTITTPAAGDTLIFDGTTNRWINRPTAAQKATFVESVNGTRTTFTLSRDAGSVNNLLVSLGGVIQEPGADFTFVAPRTVTFAAPPPAGIDYWVLIEGIQAGGGGGGGGTTLPDGTAAEEVLGWSATLGAWQPKTIINGGQF